MKIVLVEEQTGNTSEKSFQEDVIRIGRDTSDCQIAFDNNQFPMVSRRHAELRWTGGRWILYDLNSSYGTFVDGNKITAPQPVEVGSRLQFGLQGPVLRVVRFETFSESGSGLPAQSNFPQNSPPVFPKPYADSPPIAVPSQKRSGSAPPDAPERAVAEDPPSI